MKSHIRFFRVQRAPVFDPYWGSSMVAVVTCLLDNSLVAPLIVLREPDHSIRLVSVAQVYIEDEPLLEHPLVDRGMGLGDERWTPKLIDQLYQMIDERFPFCPHCDQEGEYDLDHHYKHGDEEFYDDHHKPSCLNRRR